MNSTESGRHNPWLHRFAIATSFSTWMLIWVGGLVTSTESGLSVPDWPLSYGMLMPPMVGGIFYEHGHRMVATFVGFLMTVLAVWLWRKEQRTWLRRAGWIGLGMVITQGILGGITVLYLLPTPVSVSHATLAQTFLCLTVLLAFATSQEWKQADVGVEEDRHGIRALTLLATGSVYIQLILGAVVRHTGSALAIPDFPLAFGGLFPPLEETSVVIHFIHRVGAVVVTLCLAWLIKRIWSEHRQDPRLSRPVTFMGILVVAQVLLGGTIVWTSRAVLPATAHVATGALLLATSWFVTLRAHLYFRASTPVR
jgi:cytochrome c oxidase assembly protein subunit 15